MGSSSHPEQPLAFLSPRHPVWHAMQHILTKHLIYFMPGSICLLLHRDQLQEVSRDNVHEQQFPQKPRCWTWLAFGGMLLPKNLFFSTTRVKAMSCHVTFGQAQHLQPSEGRPLLTQSHDDGGGSTRPVKDEMQQMQCWEKTKSQTGFLPPSSTSHCLSVPRLLGNPNLDCARIITPAFSNAAAADFKKMSIFQLMRRLRWWKCSVLTQRLTLLIKSANQ